MTERRSKHRTPTEYGMYASGKTDEEYAEAWRNPVPGRCIFEGCVSTDRHFHGPFPGGYENPADPDGPPIPFTTEPAPGVRDYYGALLLNEEGQS